MARKPAPKDLAKAKPTKTAEKEAKILRAEGQGKLVVAAEASVSVANTDRRIISHEGSAAQAASAKVQLLRHSQALAGKDAGFISHQTASGNSFGSLKGYMEGWNDADADEVTSKLSIANLRNIQPAVGKVENKIDLALQLLKEAKVAMKVNFCFVTSTYS